LQRQEEIEAHQRKIKMITIIACIAGVVVVIAIILLILGLNNKLCKQKAPQTNVNLKNPT